MEKIVFDYLFNSYSNKKSIQILIQSLQSIRHALHTYFLPLVKIQELYILDVNETVAEFSSQARNQMPQEESVTINESIQIIRDPLFRRLKATINMSLALQLYNTYR